MVRGTKQRDQSCVFDNVDQGNVNMKKFIEKINNQNNIILFCFSAQFQR